MNPPMPSLCKIITLTLLAAGLVLRLGGQSCANNEFEATKIVFRSEQLPIELSGFFPYVMSGQTPPQKYTSESWTGTGDAEAWGCGCHNWYTGLFWSGTWTFSTSDFTDTSGKSLTYTGSGCGYPNGAESNTLTGLKVGLANAGGGLASPGVTGQTATSRSNINPNPTNMTECWPGPPVFGPINVSETLSNEFTHEQAKSRAENFITVVENSGNLQHWDNDNPATADQAATLLANGQLTRTSPVLCHAERISFYAQFSQPCLSRARYQITCYYKKWQIGDPEPGECQTTTEEIEFTDAPYRYPQFGYKRYEFDLKQGEQCKLMVLR
jgi:hypothetical protein